jgi:hypothetical protein
MRLIREGFLFVVWLLLGWMWLMFVSLIIAGIVAFTIEYFLVTPSSPPFVGYLLSGMSLFAAALAALFSTVRTKRLGRGVLVAALVLGTLDVATSLLTRFGANVPRIGYSVIIGGASLGIGSQLVNGVALLAAVALFAFSREVDASENRKAVAAQSDDAGTIDTRELELSSEKTAARPAPPEEPPQLTAGDEPAEGESVDEAQPVDESRSATSFTT